MAQPSFSELKICQRSKSIVPMSAIVTAEITVGVFVNLPCGEAVVPKFDVAYEGTPSGRILVLARRLYG